MFNPMNARSRLSLTNNGSILNVATCNDQRQSNGSNGKYKIIGSVASRIDFSCTWNEYFTQ